MRRKDVAPVSLVFEYININVVYYTNVESHQVYDSCCNNEPF